MNDNIPVLVSMKVINAVRFTSKLRKAGRVLDKNRNLLKELRMEFDISSNAEESYSWLKIKGFDFNYHIHIESLIDGRLAIMCYEEVYLLETDGVKLFPSSSTTLLT